MSMEHYMVFTVNEGKYVKIIRLPGEVYYDLRSSPEAVIREAKEKWENFRQNLETLEELPYIYPSGEMNHDLSLLSTFADLRYCSVSEVKDTLNHIPINAWLAVSHIMGAVDEICEVFWFLRSIPSSYEEVFIVSEDDIEVIDQYTVKINKHGDWIEAKVSGVEWT